MNIIALDIGDVHTGVAYADQYGILAAPYKTVPTREIEKFIAEMFKSNELKIVVVGQPKTLRGTISAQTEKVLAIVDSLKPTFPQIKWVMWDERLTSKQARTLVAKKIKKDKDYEHCVAAAILLQSYLDARVL